MKHTFLIFMIIFRTSCNIFIILVNNLWVFSALKCQLHTWKSQIATVFQFLAIKKFPMAMKHTFLIPMIIFSTSCNIFIILVNNLGVFSASN